MKKEYGFTLVEAMLAIFVVMILATLSINGFKGSLDRKNLKQIGPIFEKSLQLARSEARKGPDIIRITPKDNGNDWSKGWIIERIYSEEAKKLLFNVDSLPGDPDFFSSDFSINNPIEIRPDGQAEAPGVFTLSVKDCTDNVQYVFRLLISAHLSRSVSECVSE